MESSVSAVGVLDKAMRILAALERRQPLTLTELIEATGLPRATTHRLAHALEVHGFVARADDDRRVLGPRLAVLGALATSELPLAERARPVLEALRDETGESAQLYVPQGTVRICVLSLESPHSLRTIVPVGAALPMDVGSAAKALRDEPEVRRRGWAQSVEEREKGVASVSAPVRNGRGVVAAVSVSGPVERTTRAPGRRYGDAVARAAAAVERAMGWKA